MTDDKSTLHQEFQQTGQDPAQPFLSQILTRQTGRPITRHDRFPLSSVGNKRHSTCRRQPSRRRHRFLLSSSTTYPCRNHNMNGPSTRDQRPCDNCRRRKTRCLFASEEANNCVLCMSRSTECTYIQDAPLKKRPRVMSATSQSISSRPTQRYSHYQTLAEEM